MLLTPVLTHVPLKGRRARAQAAAGQRRARALNKHTALHAGPSRRTVRNLCPCPARVHFRGCILQGNSQHCPGAVYDSRELETAGGPISRGLHSTQETGVCPRVAGRRLRTGRGFLCADRKPSQSPASSKGGRHRPGRSPPPPVHDMLACQASRLSKKTFEDLIAAAFRERRWGQEWGDLPSHVLSKS